MAFYCRPSVLGGYNSRIAMCILAVGRRIIYKKDFIDGLSAGLWQRFGQRYPFILIFVSLLHFVSFFFSFCWAYLFLPAPPVKSWTEAVVSGSRHFFVSHKLSRLNKLDSAGYTGTCVGVCVCQVNRKPDCEGKFKRQSYVASSPHTMPPSRRCWSQRLRQGGAIDDTNNTSIKPQKFRWASESLENIMKNKQHFGRAAAQSASICATIFFYSIDI